MDLQREKQKLRKRTQAQLSALTQEKLSEENEAILARLAHFPRFESAEHILAYFPIGREIPLLPLLKPAWTAGKQIYLPRVDPGVTNNMEFKLWHDLDSGSLESGRFSIPSPKEYAPAWTRGLEKSIILVPGLAFTTSGHRLGRGKGYYDRFLRANPELFAIGLCYSAQLANELPIQRWDRRLNAVIHP